MALKNKALTGLYKVFQYLFCIFLAILSLLGDSFLLRFDFPSRMGH